MKYLTYLSILFLISGCNENSYKDEQVYHIVDMPSLDDSRGSPYIMENSGYYLGKLHIDIPNDNIWLESVKTNETDVIEKIKKKEKIIKERFAEIKLDGIIDNRKAIFKETNKIILTDAKNMELIKYKYFNMFIPIKDEIGEKYFMNHWSKSRNNELASSVRYFDLNDYNREISKDEYYKQHQRKMFLLHTKTIIYIVLFFTSIALLFIALIKIIFIK